MKRTILFAVICVSVVLLSGVEAQENLRWEAVSKSNDINVYYWFLKENPKTEHLDELKEMVDKYMKNKAAKAEKEGYEVIANATLIPGIKSGGGAFGLESTFWLAGGKIELASVEWYSDPTKRLVVQVTDAGMQYVEGKGIGIVGKKVYTFGFPISQPGMPSSINRLLPNTDIKVVWTTNEAQAESLKPLQATPQAYDIVVLEKGHPSAEVSIILRNWLQAGGIIWAFDRAFGSTWRNKALFGGLIPGADKDWEPPEKVMVMVQGLAAIPYDKRHPVAKGVETIVLAEDHTTAREPGSDEVYAGLTVFERAFDSTAVPLLKAQKVGEAVISNKPFRPSGWVVIGFTKRVGKGQVVILPSLDYTTRSAGAQFLSNLAEWCISQKER